MSVKSSKPEKKKPRAMPVETIVTRFKSAQQKQLLANQSKTAKQQKNTKTKNVQSIKCPERKSVRQKKVPQKIIKAPEKPIVIKEQVEEIKVDNKEYYPNKLKRKVLNAKKFLAPKHSFKVVCGMNSLNRRKLHVPQRDAEYIKKEMKQPCQDTNKSQDTDKLKQKQAEISIVDMVRIIEENGSLDDEDLLEILTCPSPVWWEETPDGYLEEPLFSQPQILDKQTNKMDIKKEQKDKEESNNNTDIIQIESINVNIDNKDKSFINKRCKLEALLGNIKNKTRPILKEETQRTISEDKVRYTNKEREVKKEKSREKSNSESIEEEEQFLECHDDEILKQLENINIPTESTVTREELVDHHQESIKIKSKESKSGRESCSIGDMTEEYLDLSLLDDDIHKDDVNSDELLENSSSTNKDNSKDNELVTVYKILNSDEDTDRTVGKIDSYYKCKKNKMNVSKNIDTNTRLSKDNSSDSENRSIIISESEKVKYCLVCSSIYNTNKCNYCIRKNLKRKAS